MLASMIRTAPAERALEVSDPDVRLLELSRRGDHRAFEQLFRKYQAYVFNVAMGMLGNAEDAADITQETFLRLHRNLGSFRGDACFSTWLYRITVNLSITELRRKGRSRFQFLEEVAPDDPNLHEEVAPDPSDFVDRDEDGRAVREILQTLPPDYRAIMVLRHYQQLAYEEIAEVLGLTMSQVKTRLFRARKQFKQKFEEQTGAADAV